MALPTKNRLKNKKDFDAVFKEGKTVKGSFLFIKAKVNQKQTPRFGFLISKNTIPKAVERNRLKRVLSETASNLIKSKTVGNYDIVVVIKRKETGDAIRSDLAEALTRLQIK